MALCPGLLLTLSAHLVIAKISEREDDLRSYGVAAAKTGSWHDARPLLKDCVDKAWFSHSLETCSCYLALAWAVGLGGQQDLKTAKSYMGEDRCPPNSPLASLAYTILRDGSTEVEGFKSEARTKVILPSESKAKTWREYANISE